MNVDDNLIKHWATLFESQEFQRNGKMSFLSEGMHWPEDYVKKAVNRLKASPVGKFSSNVEKDVDMLVGKFGALSHKSSNLGYFLTIIRWFIEYSGDSKQKYQEFKEKELNDVISALQTISADKNSPVSVDKIKKMGFSDFKKVIDTMKSNQDLNIDGDGKYKVVPISSYEEMNERYGGKRTGYAGDSMWCHTNGEKTYDDWTVNGTRTFFVIEKEGWEKIQPPDPNTVESAYDEYGMSLIAILVEVDTNRLLRSTLRWNHVVLPKSGDADQAFDSWEQLNKAVGMDVKKVCGEKFEKIRAETERKNLEVTRELNERLARMNPTEINGDIVDDCLGGEENRRFVTKVEIPPSVTSIGGWAFFNCSSLQSVEIPSSVKSIGQRAFSSCTSLRSVEIPSSVTSIKEFAFSSCDSLESIEIPSSVTSIGYGAFSYCNSLESIEIPSSVTSIGDQAFYYCTNLKNVTIPSSVTSIGGYAFAYCTSIKNVTISPGVRNIQKNAFHNCARLQSVTIPDSVTSIGEWAFCGCRRLETVKIQGINTKIHPYAFLNCPLAEFS